MNQAHADELDSTRAALLAARDEASALAAAAAEGRRALRCEEVSRGEAEAARDEGAAEIARLHTFIKGKARESAAAGAAAAQTSSQLQRAEAELLAVRGTVATLEGELLV